MELLKKLREVGLSVLPLLVLVSLTHFLLSPLPPGYLTSFFIGSVLLVAGLSVFLLGTQLSLIPIGERLGSAATRKKNLFFLLTTGLVIGCVIVFAEPNVTVLVTQVQSVNPAIPRMLMVGLMAFGVGIFLVIALLRIVFHLSLRWLFAIGYGIIFLLASLKPTPLVSIAFDSGGAATGPLAVPFIMALGIGTARVQKDQEDADNFGFIALASMGPIMGLMLMGLLFQEGSVPASAVSNSPQVGNFIALFPSTLKLVSSALWPLLVLCLVYQIILLRLPFGQLLRMLLGFLYVFAGLVLFFIGVDGSFMSVGYTLGIIVAGIDPTLCLAFGALLGAITVIAEPSVWVLVDQVKVITKGHIRPSVMLVSLSLGVAISGFLAMLRIMTGIWIGYFVIPAYALAIIVSFFLPKLFVGLAFDSGTVASGPLAATFILSFAIGASEASGGNPATDAFGLITFVSMTPVVVVALLGLLYKKKQAKLVPSKRGEDA